MRCVSLGDVHNLAAEVFLTGKLRPVGLVGVKTDANHQQIEVRPALSLFFPDRQRPTGLAVFAWPNVRDAAMQADVRRQAEVFGIAFQILLKDRPGRKVRRTLGQGPVGILIEFLLNLDAEIHVAVGPDSPEGTGALEHGAFEALCHQCLGRDQPGNAGTDDAGRLDSCQVHACASPSIARTGRTCHASPTGPSDKSESGLPPSAQASRRDGRRPATP
jgi:hypothetical protein